MLYMYKTFVCFIIYVALCVSKNINNEPGNKIFQYFAVLVELTSAYDNLLPTTRDPLTP